MKEFVSENVEDTKRIAEEFVNALIPDKSKATIVGLYGDLGAGKTTFMKSVAEVLGIKETIQSPTFVIEKIYELENQIFKHLIHIDAYRLDSSEELLKLGWQEIIANPQNLICIEWPERVQGVMPLHIMIRFEHGQDSQENSESHRKISIA